eukprot:scaffold49758_cov31-Tisochrysis_lutea.AAC.1
MRARARTIQTSQHKCLCRFTPSPCVRHRPAHHNTEAREAKIPCRTGSAWAQSPDNEPDRSSGPRPRLPPPPLEVARTASREALVILSSRARAQTYLSARAFSSAGFSASSCAVAEGTTKLYDRIWLFRWPKRSTKVVETSSNGTKRPAHKASAASTAFLASDSAAGPSPLRAASSAASAAVATCSAASSTSSIANKPFAPASLATQLESAPLVCIDVLRSSYPFPLSTHSSAAIEALGIPLTASPSNI